MKFSIDLVNRSKAGDTQAFGELYSMIYTDLCKYAYYLLKNSEDVKDVVSETVTDAFLGIKGLKNPDAFGSWIFRILYSKCKRKLKEYSINRAELVENSAEDNRGMHIKKLAEGSNISEELDSAMDLKNAFMLLKEEDREIVALSVFTGFNSTEISKLVNMKPATVRTRLKRALEVMKNELRPNYY